MEHKIKVPKNVFEPMLLDMKTFDVQRRDLMLTKSDTLLYQEYDSETLLFSGRQLRCSIPYIISDHLALSQKYAVFSLKIEKVIYAEPDIIMCNNANCIMSNTCYRFNRVPNEENQQYQTFEPIVVEDFNLFSCRYSLGKPYITEEKPK